MTINMEDRIKKIFEEHFEIDLDKYHVDFELMLRKKDPEQFDIVKELYEKRLKKSDNNTLYLSDDIIIHIQQLISLNELSGISSKYWFYYPICSKEEIKRIENIQNIDDYLLKIRADSIAYNPRFNRIFLSRYQKRKGNNQNWSITEFYKTHLFNSYINRLAPDLKNMCLNVSPGFALITEPNGVCMKTQYGNIILVSESLQYFLHFMNMHFFCDVPIDDSQIAVLIAMRIFIEKEALDFDLDPRGDLPDSEMRRIEEALRWQLEFVIGHEYAHLLLGHLSEGNAKEVNSLLFNVKPDKYIECKIYFQNEQQEFEADLASIKNANYDEYEQASAIYQACLFFYYLHLGEVVSSYLFPRLGRPRTHPRPLDRVKNLRNNLHVSDNIIPDSEFENIEKIVAKLEHVLKEELLPYLPYQTDKFDMYGSMYLPSYKKEFLQDRIDF